MWNRNTRNAIEISYSAYMMHNVKHVKEIHEGKHKFKKPMKS